MLSAPTGFAAEKKYKVLHSHASHEGGLVVMAGDDHVEVKKGAGHNQLEFFITDKFRDPVSFSDEVLQITLVQETERVPLTVTADPKRAHVALVQLPHNLIPEAASLEIIAYRKAPAKGHLQIKTPQKVSLFKLYSGSDGKDHSQHGM